jgi:sulfate permease, SulP family
VSAAQTTKQKTGGRWRLPLFQSLLPLDRSGLAANLAAGISLAAMNIPQAMGYAKIAGTPVITGLYTLLLPLVAFAALGSSRYLVVASDSATAAILAGGLSGLATAGSAHYVSLAGLVALLTAGFLLLARLAKLGFLADFLSRTVLIGFLTGVGFQVGIAILSDMLKLDVHSTNPIRQLLQVVRQFPHANIPTLCLSAGVVALVLLCYRFVPRFPGALLAVVGAVVASAAFHFSGHGIQVVGPVAGGPPHLSVPPLNWRLVRDLLPVAGSCFVMIVAQSSVTARAYAAKHHQTLDENRDLLGISAANAAAALSGTFEVNGSPTQTAMVETSGGSNQNGAPLDGPRGLARAPFPHRSPAISSGLCAWRDCLHDSRPSRGFAGFKRSPPEEPSRVDSCPRNRRFRSFFWRGGRHSARTRAVAASARTPQLRAFGSGENANGRRQLAGERC